MQNINKKTKRFQKEATTIKRSVPFLLQKSNKFITSKNLPQQRNIFDKHLRIK